jgi:putative ATP-dependent endonuclease of OLD family
MAKIYSLKIDNYRGVKNFKQVFGFTNFVCLIGRGDSGKTTILDAISKVLSPNWNLPLIDTDFYNSDIENPIQIEVTLYDLPDKLTTEDKYGLYTRCLNRGTGEISKSMNDDDESVLTLKLIVESDLEPKWYIEDNQQAPKEIKARDRAMFNTFLVSDYVDKHFSWNYGSPLYALLKQEKKDTSDNKNIIINSLRAAKVDIDKNPAFDYLNTTIEKLKTQITKLGIDIGVNTQASIDVRDLFMKDGKVCLHEATIPFRLKGKGAKRLISIAIQTALVEDGGIILIDEIEQGLEPDRAQHLANALMKSEKSQIFITTHSRDVLVELSAKYLFLMKSNAERLIAFNEEIQGLLRISPEAFFAKRILLCEGATEVGFCRSLNNYRIEEKKKENLSLKGIRIVNGGGSSQVKYAKQFIIAKFDVCLFCDSDVSTVNDQKEDLKRQGINIVDCGEGYSLEQQLFNDLPWEGVKELVNYRIMEKSENSVIQSIEADYDHKLDQDWLEKDDKQLRLRLGIVSSKITKIVREEEKVIKEWFKRIDHGMFLGEICCKYFDEMDDSKQIKKQIKEISDWIDND